MAIAAKQEMPVFFEDDNLHLRKNSDYILQSTTQLPRHLDQQCLPIAGLRSAVLTENGTEKITLREKLNPVFRPVVIIDLDNTVWPHTHDLLRAISHVTGIEATDEDLTLCGHTRKISQWQAPKIDSIQDTIQANRHPDVNPFVSRAHQKAVETVHAVDAMGHLYAYLTGRMSEMFETTKRVIAWNRLPFDPSAQRVDARTHMEPKRGYLYCSPVDPKQVNEYKKVVVNTWLHNLREAGWLGKMIIIDDTPKAFREEIENGDVTAIALDGPLNHIMPPLIHEVRVECWDEIALLLQKYHSEAVARDPAPTRIFTGENGDADISVTVNKQASGCGYFTLEQLPPAAYSLSL